MESNVRFVFLMLNNFYFFWLPYKLSLTYNTGPSSHPSHPFWTKWRLTKEGTFYITTLIVPKQESTSSSCQALNEEEIFSIQYEVSDFPIGWIHTHPSQTCFMSSVDLHTQYSYQSLAGRLVRVC
ncbi:hypothetical protein POM88_003500 [Heracleum sosnowskyi]|uniref:MPN domain-containing protein n=1 Tax=Heracleum sosnowskyi TaxID=360622 RepID=A0AAD8JG27_9APIA|nr:hypothetical protein POM88_003500 [Heracleum sosnowskyi]